MQRICFSEGCEWSFDTCCFLQEDFKQMWRRAGVWTCWVHHSEGCVSAISSLNVPLFDDGKSNEKAYLLSREIKRKESTFLSRASTHKKTHHEKLFVVGEGDRKLRQGCIRACKNTHLYAGTYTYEPRRTRSSWRVCWYQSPCGPRLWYLQLSVPPRQWPDRLCSPGNTQTDKWRFNTHELWG